MVDGYGRLSLRLTTHLCGVSREQYNKRLVPMMTAFFDESGEDKSAFFMGGWVARPEEWDHLTIEWDRVLKAPPSIDYFSHHEALSFTGEFEKFNSCVSERDSKMEKLAQVVSEHDLYGVVGISVGQKIVDDALKSLSSMGRKVLLSMTGPINPYAFCFPRIIQTVLHIEFELGRREPVNFFFDQQVGLFEECLTAFRESQHKLPEAIRALLGSITMLVNDRCVIALQTADLLVGQQLLKLHADTPILKFRNDIALRQFIPENLDALVDAIQSANEWWKNK